MTHKILYHVFLMFMSELLAGLAEVTPQLTISSIYINYCLHYSTATLPNTHDKGENILISVNLNILFAFWGCLQKKKIAEKVTLEHSELTPPLPSLNVTREIGT